MKVVRKNKGRENTNTFYTEMMSEILADKHEGTKNTTDQIENILDIR